MNRRTVAAVGAAALAALPAVALGHAELVGSDPAPDAVLATPPEEVVLTFDDELDPDLSGVSVADGDGIEIGVGGVDLDVAERNVLRAELDIHEPGTYVVSWTAAASDGHRETGSYAFAFGDESAPDTAMHLPSSRIAVGLALVGLALLVTARTATRAAR